MKNILILFCLLCLCLSNLKSQTVIKDFWLPEDLSPTELYSISQKKFKTTEEEFLKLAKEIGTVNLYFDESSKLKNAAQVWLTYDKENLKGHMGFHKTMYKAKYLKIQLNSLREKVASGKIKSFKQYFMIAEKEHPFAYEVISGRPDFAKFKTDCLEHEDEMFLAYNLKYKIIMYCNDTEYEKHSKNPDIKIAYIPKTVKENRVEQYIWR
jgi:hypothetical protein